MIRLLLVEPKSEIVSSVTSIAQSLDYECEATSTIPGFETLIRKFDPDLTIIELSADEVLGSEVVVDLANMVWLKPLIFTSQRGDRHLNHMVKLATSLCVNVFDSIETLTDTEKVGSVLMRFAILHALDKRDTSIQPRLPAHRIPKDQDRRDPSTTFETI